MLQQASSRHQVGSNQPRRSRVSSHPRREHSPQVRPSPHAIVDGMSKAGSPVSADLGAIHEIGAPIHVYPLFENGYRAHRRQTIQDNNNESARLYGEFAKVAERQPYAWNYGKAAKAEVIGTVSKKNRMICFPCGLPQNETTMPLTERRPALDECVQHNQSGRRHHLDVHRFRKGAWCTREQVDIRSWRRWHQRQR